MDPTKRLVYETTAVFGPVLHWYLARFTWLALAPVINSVDRRGRREHYKSPADVEVIVDQLLSIQQLRTVSRLWCRVITKWFQQEWKHSCWAQIFNKFASHGGRPVSGLKMARRYFLQLVNADVKWDRWGDIRYQSWTVVMAENQVRFYTFVLGDVCRIEMDCIPPLNTLPGNRRDRIRLVVTVDIKTGKRCGSDRYYFVEYPGCGYMDQIECDEPYEWIQDHSKDLLCNGKEVDISIHPLQEFLPVLVLPQFATAETISAILL